MLANLMSVDVTHTPPGGTITCAQRHRDGHTTLEVRDTGIGIHLRGGTGRVVH
jgi:signal transduction histidine kinase